jgi:putrescine transport system ATP-binding protein
MFQSYALFPHMTVERNIAFGLHQEGLPRREIASRVEEALRLVQLTRFAKRRPHQLSGGQRQRVALARCLVKRPKLLLLDEPLAALDKRLREQTQFELAAIQEKVGVTFIMVTHDQGEAMTMSSRLAVMREGRIEQVGTPAEIYEFPRTRFVADFIGTMNIFEGKVSRAAQGEAMVESAEAGATLRAEGGGAAAGATAFVAVRPEKIAIARAGDPAARADNVLEGVVEEIAYLGQSSTYVVALPSGKRVHVSAQNAVRRAELPISWDQRVVLTFPARAALVLAE